MNSLLKNPMGHFFEDFWNSHHFLDRDYSDDSINAWSPVFHWKKNEKELHLFVEIPGVRKEDLNVELTGNELHLSGHRGSKEEKGITYAKFSKRFKVDETLDFSKIEAKHEDGILSLTIPYKKELYEKKLIKIQ